MSKFNLMHCIPHPKMHGLNGYKEVIDSIEWGLLQLGHEVNYSLNESDSSATNIIFGAQVLPIETLKQLPSDTIVYNFEQIRGLQKDKIRPEVSVICERFQIWEYSLANFDSWKMLGVDKPKLVPVGYAPVLTRIPKPDIQDIDILIYGLPGNKRVNAFHKLAQAGLKVVFLCGFYGESRDALIARSKVILNINLYDFAQIFEIVRVSYLLANKKAVVATLDQNTTKEDGLDDAIRFTTLDKIVEDCVRLLENENERSKLEIEGYNTISKRGIKEILQVALS